jgi:hypothetical protein
MMASKQRDPERGKRSPSRRTRQGVADSEPGGVTPEAEASSPRERRVPRFVVPPHALSYLLEDLPLRPATRRALKGVAWSTLGDLDNVPWSRLGREGRNFGFEAISDLASIIALARLGRLVIVPDRGSGSFEGLCGALDGALAQLDPPDRQVILLRFGAGHVPPLTHRETARRCGLGTRQAAESRLAYALKRLRRIAGPAFEDVLRDLETRVDARREPIADLLKQLGAQGEGKHGLTFYARLLLKLLPGSSGVGGAERR